LRYVIDASVATKWLLPDGDSPSALKVLDAALARRITLVAPALIGLEFGHVLGKELRRGRCDAATAERLWSAFRGLPMALVSARLLQDRAFLISITRRVTIYDSDSRVLHMDAVGS